MARGHDDAAKRIAKKVQGTYDPAKSPDVKGPGVRVEVKKSTTEISRALEQLSGGRGRAYIALPTSEQAKAQERLKKLQTGLMDWRGNIKKPSTRKRK